MITLIAFGFCERTAISSCANLVLTEGKTWLSDEEMETLVALCMNKKFMAFMRYYPMFIGLALD